MSGPCPVIVDLAFEETSRYVTCDIRRVCPALLVVFIFCCCNFLFWRSYLIVCAAVFNCVREFAGSFATGSFRLQIKKTL